MYITIPLHCIDWHTFLQIGGKLSFQRLQAEIRKTNPSMQRMERHKISLPQKFFYQVKTNVKEKILHGEILNGIVEATSAIARVCVIQERSFVRDRFLLPWSILIPCPVNSLKLYKGNVVMPREALSIMTFL